MTLIAWHGFLGSPKVWDLWTAESFGVSQFIPQELKSIPSTASPRYLMGYSLGGRLALQHLVAHENDFEGAILISTHPGLKKDEDRKRRIEIDEKWALRFEKENFQVVLKEWNSQSLFSGSSFPLQPEETNRLEYVHCLRCYSLGLQEELRNKIAQLKIPLLWITGEKDEKFVSLAEEIANLHPFSKHITLPHVGHRAPWDQPDLFAAKVKVFLDCIGVNG